MSHLTRREFLTTAGFTPLAAAAAMALAPHVRGAEEAAASRKIGFAIVGLGRFGAGQLLRSLPECQFARPAALVSGHPDKAKQLADKYGIPPRSIYNYENFDSIKDNPDVDVVYVVLPNSMHHEYTLRAAAAGKHVLCEKPMAVSAKECREMIDACHKANRKLMIGYRLHYEPTTQKAQQICRDGTLGPLRMIESAHSFNIGPNEWRTQKKLSGGGPVLDLGIYCINAVRYLVGEEPTHVSAQTWQPKDDERFKDTDATMAFSMKFPSGVLANCTTSYAQHGLNYYRACGVDGELLAQPSFTYGGIKLHLKQRGAERPAPEFPQVNQFAAEMDHFAGCILNDKSPASPGEEGLADMKVIDALYASAESGKTVEVK